MSSYTKNILTGSAYTFVSRVLVQLISIVRSVILARFLGPENLGILTILRDIGGVIIPFIMFGIPTAMTKFVAEFRHDRNKLQMVISTGFFMILIISFIGTAIYFLSADYFAVKIYSNPLLGKLMKINALYIVFSVLIPLGMGFLQGFQKYRQMAIIGVVNAAIALPILYFFVIYMDIVGVIIAGVFTSIINFIVLLKFVVPAFRENNISLKPRFNIIISKMILKFSSPLLLSVIILRPARLYGLSYLAIASSYTSVGYFRVAMGLHNIALFIPSALSVPLLPLFSELQTNSQKRSVIVSKIIRLQILIFLPFVLCLGLASKYILFVLYGSEYVSANYITYIMLTTAFLSSIFSILTTLLISTGRTKHVLMIDIANSLMFYLASAHFINLFGVNGLGFVWLGTSIILIIPYLVYLIRSGDIIFSLIRMPMLIGSLFLILGFVVITFYQNNSIILITTILLLLLTELLIISDDDKKLARFVFENVKDKL